jgi:hypothetical protein
VKISEMAGRFPKSTKDIPGRFRESARLGFRERKMCQIAIYFVLRVYAFEDNLTQLAQVGVKYFVTKSQFPLDKGITESYIHAKEFSRILTNPSQLQAFPSRRR